MSTLYTRASQRRISSPCFGESYSILPDDWTPEERECTFYLPYFYENGQGIFFTSDVPHVMAAIYAWQRDICVGHEANYEYLLDFLGIEELDSSYADQLTFDHYFEDGFFIDIDIGEKRNGYRKIVFMGPPITFDEYDHKNDRYY